MRRLWWFIKVVEVVTVVLVVGVFEEAKCPKKRKKKRLTHFKTMPQAAGKNGHRHLCWKYPKHGRCDFLHYHITMNKFISYNL